MGWTKETHPFLGYIPKRPTAPKYSGAKGIIKMLEAYEAEYFFGIPGTTMALWAEIPDSSVRSILAKDERAAAYMADGYARISSKPGICTAQVGAGTLNLLTGIATAYACSVPIIAIADAKPHCEDDKGDYGGGFARGDTYDTLETVRPFTKWSFRVDNIHRIPEIIQKAFKISTEGRPGPTYLEFDAEVIHGKWEMDIRADKEFTHYPAMRVAPDPAKIGLAVQLISKAQNPVIVAGGGVLISNAWQGLLELAETLAIPIATTANGKGSIPENHPLSLGVVGIHSRGIANKFVEEADLVIFVGTRTSMYNTNKWRLPTPGKGKIIQIDIDPREIAKNYLIDVAILGDAKLTLETINSAFKRAKKKALTKLPRVKEIAKARKEWWDSVYPSYHSNDVPIKSPRLIKEIREFLSPEDLLVADFACTSVWAMTYYDVLRSGRHIIYDRGMAAMGWGFPASIGAKLATPDKKVLSIVGDGSFGFHIGELETCVRENVPIVVLIFDNRCLGADKYLMNFYYDKVHGVDLADVDYGKVAESFGCYGRRIEKPSEIRPALEEAFKSGKPAVIDALIDINTLPPGYPPYP